MENRSILPYILMQDKNIDYLKRLDHLLAETIALPIPARKIFLKKESKEDTGIRDDVLEMMESGISLSKSKAELIEMINSISDSTTLPGDHFTSPYKLVRDAYNLVGKTVLHYEILSLIGGGGMGLVYKGKDTRLDRYVALKFLSPRLIENQETKERFLNEARAASKLDHQNIGVIHEICDTDDRKSFIVMAFYEGQTLKDKMNASRLSPERAFDYAMQIARGLAFSHKKGIVHRDIKPSNIIITPENQVKIVDFGLALFVDRPLPNDSKKIMGTMGYMAPEQRQGGITDFRTDIWSLGVILHEMLLGKRPDVARNTFITREKKQTGYSFPFKSLDAAKLSKLLTRALQPNPDNRYPSISDFLVDLKKVSPDHKHTLPFFQRVNRWTLLWSLLIGALLIPLLFSSFSPFASKQDAKSIGIQLLAITPDSPGGESYLASGVTEEIISQLAQFDAMQVVSLLYMDELNRSALDFAQNQGLTWISNGAIHLVDERIRISLQVSHTETSQVVAAVSEEGNLEELQKLIYDLSTSLVHELRNDLFSNGAHPSSDLGSIVPEAYDTYLRGKYHFELETPDHLEMALKLYDEAILIDPSFARAYASQVVPIYLLGDKYNRMPSHSAFYLAEKQAEKALELNAQLPEGYVAQGIVRQLIDNDFEGARRSFERAIELNPQESEAYREYGLLLLRMGLIDQGLEQLYHSQTLNPTSLQTRRDVARAFYYKREHIKAIELLNEILALQPGYFRAYSLKSNVYLALERYDEAEAAYTEAQKYDKSESKVNQLGFVAEVKAARGETELAMEILDEMLEYREKENATGAASLCLVYARLGNQQETKYWFEKALDEGDLPPSIRVDARWDSVRSIIELPEDLAIRSVLTAN